jgi:regulator of cell morphogenesis and NO signaling
MLAMTTFSPSAPLAELVAHVVSTHHAFLRAELPRLAALTAEAARRPGPHQAALNESAILLARFGADMLAHLDHEEQAVFPLMLAIERGGPDAASAHRQLAAQRSALEAAHVHTGAELDELHRICDMVPAPDEAEPLLDDLLEAYARVITDTHTHVAFENDVLLPRAIALASPRAV